MEKQRKGHRKVSEKENKWKDWGKLEGVRSEDFFL
jgi:hypothetical protein